MADTIANNAAPKAKAAKGKAVKPEHPKYMEMVMEAIKDLKERNGSSRQSIQKWVDAKYKVGSVGALHVRMALKKGVIAGTFSPAKGHSNTFRLTPAAKKPVKVAKKVVKKPVAKKVVKKVTAKKTTVKKATKAAKKPVAKKPVAAKVATKAKAVAKPKATPKAKTAAKPKVAKKAAKVTKAKVTKKTAGKK